MYKKGSLVEFDEPCLIEVGARLHGVKGSFVFAANACIGYNLIDVSRDIYSNPAAFDALPSFPVRLLKNGMQIFLISSSSGVLKGYPLLHEITSRPSFCTMNMFYKIGETIVPTQNGWTSPGNITLVHEDADVMQADYEFIMKLTACPEFFDVSP